MYMNVKNIFIIPNINTSLFIFRVYRAVNKDLNLIITQ